MAKTPILRNAYVMYGEFLFRKSEAIPMRIGGMRYDLSKRYKPQDDSLLLTVVPVTRAYRTPVRDERPQNAPDSLHSGVFLVSAHRLFTPIPPLPGNAAPFIIDRSTADVCALPVDHCGRRAERKRKHFREWMKVTSVLG
ncbi:hypothetical protein J6590_030801 [Homalodisca vitripennis]|nr:hypothetical protein J6590_030801 [Homalodisca vitripennis]